MFSSRNRIEEVEVDIERLKGKVEVIEKELLNLYVFIDSYLDKVEAQDLVMTDIKPMLNEVSGTLRLIVKKVMV